MRQKIFSLRLILEKSETGKGKKICLIPNTWVNVAKLRYDPWPVSSKGGDLTPQSCASLWKICHNLK